MLEYALTWNHRGYTYAQYGPRYAAFTAQKRKTAMSGQLAAYLARRRELATSIVLVAFAGTYDARARLYLRERTSRMVDSKPNGKAGDCGTTRFGDSDGHAKLV